MIVLAHDLRRHVARSTARLIAVVHVGNLLAGNAKVGQLEISGDIEDQILRLDVTMDDIGAMHQLKRLKEAGYEESRLLFRETLLAGQVEAQVTAEK